MRRSPSVVARLLTRRAGHLPGLRRLGTEYGGWWFVRTPSLRGGSVISAGAGEDISFDVGLAREHGATVTVVDPTPRAVVHVAAALERV